MQLLSTIQLFSGRILVEAKESIMMVRPVFPAAILTSGTLLSDNVDHAHKEHSMTNQEMYVSRVLQDLLLMQKHSVA